MSSVEEQQILGEIRAARRELCDISLMLRVDTPWIKLKEQTKYALECVRFIPLTTRVFLCAGVILSGFGALFRNLKLIITGVDCVFLSLLFVGGEA